MIMKEYVGISPLKILEKTSRKGLGPGNLGVLMARAGVGKTVCLIHIALDKTDRGVAMTSLSIKKPRLSVMKAGF